MKTLMITLALVLLAGCNCNNTEQIQEPKVRISQKLSLKSVSPDTWEIATYVWYKDDRNKYGSGDIIWSARAWKVDRENLARVSQEQCTIAKEVKEKIEGGLYDEALAEIGVCD